MNILIVGLAGVPYSGRACDPRLANVANLLADNGNSVIILNRYSSAKNNKLKGIPLNRDIETIEIINPRLTGRIMTLSLFLLSVLYEPFELIRIIKKRKVDSLYVYTLHYWDLLMYRIVTYITGTRMVYDYVEYMSKKFDHPNLYRRINYYLLDHKGAKLLDKCICISNYLKEKVYEVNPKIPVFKLTPLCDFYQFENNCESIDLSEPYLMFCGSAGYFDIVKLIIDSYKKSIINKKVKLLMVLAGSDHEVERVTRYYRDCIIRRKIPYNQLVAYYKHAYALIIPIRDQIDDIARFPNKICEYAAAHGLIVTTNYGEIPIYFKNGENALVADYCTVDSISERLDELSRGEYDVSQIRENCFKTGKDYFSIDTYKQSLPSFLEKRD